MRIKVTEKNAAQIEAILDEVNGRAASNTITKFNEVLSIASQFEDELIARGLPRVHQRGATVVHAPDFRFLPKAYKGSIITTQLKIERAASGFFLTGVERVYRYSGNSETHEITISEAQQDIILLHAMRGMKVAAAA